MAEIQSKHVDAGLEQRPDRFRRRRGGAQRGHDFGQVLPSHERTLVELAPEISKQMQ